MPIQQIRFIYCDACGIVLKTETHGDVFTPEEFQKYFGPQKKQLCKACRKAARKKWF
ncbi:MAG: hypothetical protein ABS949_08600 [Solibacillus sp.]